MQEKTKLSVMLKRTTYSLFDFRKGMTIDKEQTSDKNGILTNLNDSVNSSLHQIRLCWCCLCIAVINNLALVVYKWSVMAHQPLLRGHGPWQMRSV